MGKRDKVEEVVFLRDNKYTILCEKYRVRDKKKKKDTESPKVN